MAWTERYITASAPGGGDGSQGLPWTLAEGLTNLATGMRLNLLAGTYTRTAGINVTIAGPLAIQGYSVTPGDGGRATLSYGNTNDGGLTLNAGYQQARDLILTSTYAGSNQLYAVSMNGTGCTCERVIASGWSGKAFYLNGSEVKVIHCEAYNCCTVGTSAQGAFTINYVGGCSIVGCIAHDINPANANSYGFLLTEDNQAATIVDCIADTCGGYGFCINRQRVNRIIINCDAYNCALGGFYCSVVSYTPVTYLKNCNAISNGGYGYASGQLGNILILENCFDYGNTSGRLYDTGGCSDESPSSHYTAVPYIDGPNGNFALDRVNGVAGRGASARFLQTLGYTASIPASRDIGAAQHADPVLGLPASGSLYAGKTVTVDGTAAVTGTLRASNISGPDAANAGENLSAPILGSGHTVDGIAGSLSGGGGGGMGGIFETIVR
jgi:hypothetical protein